jgi:alpha-glucuronidase
MKSGKTLWEELCRQYFDGAEKANQMHLAWRALKGNVDEERFDHVSAFLKIQKDESELWRDACVLYFQTFSRMEIPAGLSKPEYPLDYYEKLSFPYAPGIRPQW